MDKEPQVMQLRQQKLNHGDHAGKGHDGIGEESFEVFHGASMRQYRENLNPLWPPTPNLPLTCTGCLKRRFLLSDPGLNVAPVGAPTLADLESGNAFLATGLRPRLSPPRLTLSYYYQTDSCSLAILLWPIQSAHFSLQEPFES